MELAYRFHDLADDRETGDGSRLEARDALLQIDRIKDVLGNDQVGIRGSIGPRERDDEVRDRPSLLDRQAVRERRHRRAVEPGAHRPEDILACRPGPEGPALREVCGAYRISQVVRQCWSRRSIAPAEVAVALQAAGLHVKLLP